MKRVSLTVWAVRLTVSLTFMVAGPDVALSYEGDDDESFRIGESCAAMAYTDEAVLRELTSSEHQAHFDAFCFPEEPFFCSDYSSFVGNLGEMTVGSDGYMCRFVPEGG